MPEGNRVAVVDVADGDADDVRSESESGFAGSLYRMPGEAEIEESHLVPGRIERGRNACQTVGHHRIRLSLAIRAHEEHPRSVRSIHPTA
jgi:hypothetical protein